MYGNMFCVVTTCLFHTHVLKTKESNTANVIEGRRVHLVSTVNQGSNVVMATYGDKRGREHDAPRSSELVHCAHTCIYSHITQGTHTYIPTAFCLSKPMWTAVPECRQNHD